LDSFSRARSRSLRSNNKLGVGRSCPALVKGKKVLGGL
jgi:hypothetical protein